MIVRNYDERGIIEESIFKASVEAYSNFGCFKSSENDDKFKHIDFYLGNGQSVDVKTSNKIFNSEHHIWLEIMNIWGNKGWLSGRATFIAFSLGDKYVFFKRRDLKWYIYNRINVDKVHLKIGKIKCYNVYRRSGFKDKIVLVPLRHLLRLDHFFIKRDKNLFNGRG